MHARTICGFLLSTALLLLCACTPTDSGNATATPASAEAGPPASAPAADASTDLTQRHVNPAWNFRLDVPVGWSFRHGFPRSYLANGAWKTFAAPDSSGTPVVAVILPGSDPITDAELRIGVSRAPSEVAECATPPQAMRPGSVEAVTINGIRFTRFDAGDAAMSHHLNVHAYRVVHDGACYAIDLLVYGVNPQVYDPPATPPFTDRQAFARLQPVLNSFRFTY